MKTIKRQEYLDFLVNSKDKQIVKVVSGVRRCGKSTLFQIYRDYLLSLGVSPQQIISINFEDIEFEHLKDYRKLYEFIKQKLMEDNMNYIFLDEIQNVPMFEKTVDSLFIKENTDLYITGSNSYFMSGELATLLSGRYVELKMLPLSFKEYCQGLNLYSKYKDKPLYEKYLLYVQNGSFPYILQYDQIHGTKEIMEYLRGIYSSVLLKDVVARNKISDVMMLESIVKFILDNTGNILSITKISRTMASFGRKIDVKTVEKYLRGLMDSLIIYQAKRYNIKGKHHLATLEKYYIVDTGLRHMMLGKKGMDAGHILENIVYLELLRKEYDVSVGQAGDFEVDFVASNYDGNLYIQVAATVRDESTLKRELRSLQAINDSYPKIILTLDEDPQADFDGIKKLNVLKWLIGEED